MPTIRTVGVISKPGVDTAGVVVPKLVAWLHARGIRVRLDEQTAFYTGVAGLPRDEVPEGLPPVLADVIRLRQVLFNLLANAVKFTIRGHIAIRARIRERELLVEVEDTGIGMDHSDLPRAFSEFVQLDDDMDRKVGGSGLGLPLSRRLVELQGGRLWAETKKGEGSTFSFTLALAQSTAPKEISA